MANNIQQGTEEWRLARAGCITASCFADAIAMTEEKINQKTGRVTPPRPKAERDKYMLQLVFEITSGVPVHEINAWSLKHGKEKEPDARVAYENRSGLFVEEVGFVTHPLYPFIGASSDGLIDNDGAIEIKCPMDEAIHLDTIRHGLPENHIAQIQGNLFVTGRQWLDFVSYDDRQAREFRLYVQRVPRDQAYIDKLEIALLQFWDEVQMTISELKAKVA